MRTSIREVKVDVDPGQDRELLELTDLLGSADGRIGIDYGSRSVKAAATVNGRVRFALSDTRDLIYSGMNIRPGTPVVSTGYGRERIPDGIAINEIRAHAVGVLSSMEMGTFTLLDIGGQDFKIVRVVNRGIADFTMNDKCAAGTGRFLEKMSEMLGMDLEELGSYTGRRKVLESTCSVFTETELISLMVEGVSKEDLASGVIYSVYERIRPHLRHYPLDTIILTGGGSRFVGIASTLRTNLDAEVMVPRHSQFMGALGCLRAILR